MNLTAGLKLKSGEIYSPQALAADRKAIGDKYGAKGYLDLAVIATPVPAGTGVVDVNFRLEEGVQYYVDKVNISGKHADEGQSHPPGTRNCPRRRVQHGPDGREQAAPR